MRMMAAAVAAPAPAPAAAGDSERGARAAEEGFKGGCFGGT